MEALKGLAELPRLGLGAEALEGLLGGLAGLARRLGWAGLFGVGVGGEGDQIRAVVLGDAGLGLGRSGLPLGGGLGRFRRRGLRRCLARFGRLALGRLLGLRLRLWRALDRLAVDRRRRGLCLGLLRPGRLRAAGVSGPYGLAFGLGLPCRGLVGRERLRGGCRLAGGTFRLGLLGWLLTGRLRAAGGSGPYGRPFGLGLLDRGRLLLLGRCLF